MEFRSTILPELWYKYDGQVVGLDLAAVWGTKNMNNDKFVDSPDTAIQRPVPLNCKFCLNPKII